MKRCNKILSLLLLLALMAAVLLVPAQAAGKNTKYPTVFVHGMLGWGSYQWTNDIVDYWGSFSGSVLDDLESQGYEVYSASVGPISSAWDRFCHSASSCSS